MINKTQQKVIPIDPEMRHFLRPYRSTVIPCKLAVGSFCQEPRLTEVHWRERCNEVNYRSDSTHDLRKVFTQSDLVMRYVWEVANNHSDTWNP